VRPLRALFVTYGVTSASDSQPSMIGVLKRCARLIACLPRGVMEIHLLHFGGILHEDPLVQALLPRLQQHMLGLGHPRLALARLFRGVAPDVVVLGEGPCDGLMAAAYEAAWRHGSRLLCIENLYLADQPARFVRDTPGVDQWLLLGLPIGHRYGRITPRAVLAPPLLSAPGRADLSAGLTVLGYDRRAAELGMDLIRRLPAHVRTRMIVSTEVRRTMSVPNNRRVSVVGMPSEPDLAAHLRGSRIVVCKNGFQQIVESLALGTPVVTYDAPGGVPEAWLAAELRPFVRYAPADSGNWTQVLSAVAVWLERRPSMPWQAEVTRIPQPGRFAARWLAALCRGTHGASLV